MSNPCRDWYVFFLVEGGQAMENYEIVAIVMLFVG